MKSLSRVWLFATPWTVPYQTPPSTGFSRQEYWSGLPFPSPGDLPDLGIEPRSSTLEADALTSEPPGKPVLWELQVLIFYTVVCCSGKSRVQLFFEMFSNDDYDFLGCTHNKTNFVIKVIWVKIWNSDESKVIKCIDSF